eukprot:1589708-Rhodomonas_salina.1
MSRGEERGATMLAMLSLSPSQDHTSKHRTDRDPQPSHAHERTNHSVECPVERPWTRQESASGRGGGGERTEGERKIVGLASGLGEGRMLMVGRRALWRIRGLSEVP